MMGKCSSECNCDRCLMYRVTYVLYVAWMRGELSQRDYDKAVLILSTVLGLREVG